ncbi:hypothetical protein HDU76_002244 [Blyttiomyces sp. JEL0837]|nr:hypothetical protein HDU76_002244 [Blyttiomyces sp. JEL0837]
MDLDLDIDRCGDGEADKGCGGPVLEGKHLCYGCYARMHLKCGRPVGSPGPGQFVYCKVCDPEKGRDGQGNDMEVDVDEFHEADSAAVTAKGVSTEKKKRNTQNQMRIYTEAPMKGITGDPKFAEDHRRLAASLHQTVDQVREYLAENFRKLVNRGNQNAANGESVKRGRIHISADVVPTAPNKRPRKELEAPTEANESSTNTRSNNSSASASPVSSVKKGSDGKNGLVTQQQLRAVTGKVLYRRWVAGSVKGTSSIKGKSGRESIAVLNSRYSEVRYSDLPPEEREKWEKKAAAFQVPEENRLVVKELTANEAFAIGRTANSQLKSALEVLG